MRKRPVEWYILNKDVNYSPEIVLKNCYPDTDIFYAFSTTN